MAVRSRTAVVIQSRLSLGLAAALVSACITSHVGPGVVREDWNQRASDPDPMHNPAEQGTDTRWTAAPSDRVPGPGEAQPPGPSDQSAAGAAGEDSPAIDLGKRAAATFLTVLSVGWTPLLEVSGTFEEDPATRKLDRQRIERATAAEHAQRVERAAASDQ